MSLLYQVGVRGMALAKLVEVRQEVFVTKPATIRRKLKFLKEVVGLRWVATVVVLRCTAQHLRTAQSRARRGVSHGARRGARSAPSTRWPRERDAACPSG